jgi:serine protease Do
MKKGATVRGALAIVLALVAAAAVAAPRGPQGGGGPDATLRVLPAQDTPDVAPGPRSGEGPAPAPMLPAPSLPGDDPVVELPPETAPEGDAEPPAAVATPDAPATGSATIFSFADLAEQLLDSVVYISTSQRVRVPRRRSVPDVPESPEGEDFFEDFFDNDDEDQGARNVQSLGSGFVIDGSGLIVTNNHVIADADEIVANFADGTQRDAEVVGVDEKTDLALLKVAADTQLTSAQFGRSERLRVGDWVVAIGNPFGFGGSVTLGIVSALDRDINSGPYDHYIQTDASINRGNSGGPLFNIDGEVVGINTAIMSPTGGSIGIGFAVPAEIAVPVIEQLRRFGSVRRGWIGVRIQNVTDEVAEGLGMEEAMGAFVAGLTDGGPAEQAGIEEGDVVVEYDGEPVPGMRDLPRLVADTPPGDTVDLVVIRDGERVTLEIEVGLLEEEGTLASAGVGDESEEDESQKAIDDAAQMFGLSLGEITEESRDTYSIDDSVDGVLITAVEAGSEADDKAVKPGEVIVQVSQKDVAAPEEVVKRIEELKEEGRRTVMLLLSGVGNKLRFVSLRFEDR